MHFKFSWRVLVIGALAIGSIDVLAGTARFEPSQYVTLFDAQPGHTWNGSPFEVQDVQLSDPTVLEIREGTLWIQATAYCQSCNNWQGDTHFIEIGCFGMLESNNPCPILDSNRVQCVLPRPYINGTNYMSDRLMGVRNDRSFRVESMYDANQSLTVTF